MPKRKPPPERRVWARMVGPEWRIHLVSGEVLTALGSLSEADARERSRTRVVFRISYGASVVELTGDPDGIESELAESEDDDAFEYSTFAMYRGDRGTEAVVIEHHH